MELIKYNRIAEVLIEKNKTQKWLAEQLGVTEEAVSHWCKQKSQPSFRNLYAAANKLGVDVRELLEPNENSPHKNFKF